MTERQCAGQDKRDTVACEAAYWVKVLKHRGQCGREGTVHADGMYFLHKRSKIKKMADQLHRYQVLLVLQKATSPASTAVSHNGALNAISSSRLTG